MKRELFRFLTVGVGSNIINFIFYTLIYALGVSLFLSSIVGYLIGLFASYHFGRTWVFGKSFAIDMKNVMRFILVYFFGGLGMSSLIILLDANTGLDYRISWLFGAVFAVINNFLGLKWFVFNRRCK